MNEDKEICEVLSAETGYSIADINSRRDELKEAGLFKPGASKQDIIAIMEGLESELKPKQVQQTFVGDDWNQQLIATSIASQVGVDSRLILPLKKTLEANAVYKHDLNPVEVRLVKALIDNAQRPRAIRDDISAGNWFVKTVGGLERAFKVLEAVKARAQADATVAELLAR